MAAGWFALIEENVVVPFEIEVLGVQAVVAGIELAEDDRVVAVLERGQSRLRVSLLDLPLPSGRGPEGGEWILAYRRWMGERG